MDPNETLTELRTAIADYRRLADAEPSGLAQVAAMAEAGARVTDAAAALDEWVTRGGFLPSDWSALRPA